MTTPLKGRFFVFTVVFLLFLAPAEGSNPVEANCLTLRLNHVTLLNLN